MKKILVSLLMLMMLTSCTTIKSKVSNVIGDITGNDDIKVKYYLELLNNYEAKEKNKNNTVDNEEFETYLDELFVETLEQGYIYMHSNISDYRSLGVKKPEVNWGEVNYDNESEVETYIDYLNELKEYDYDSLSYREQYYYDMYEYSLLETIVSMYYAKYETSFSESNDLLGGVVITLDEFKLTDKEYVDDYMLLLEDTDRYLLDVCEYVDDQAKDGIYHSDASIEYSINYVDSFVSKVEDNSLISSFEKRMKEVNFLSQSEKEKYIAKNKEVVIEEIIPAFKKVKNTLESYKGKLDDDDAQLCNIDKNYADVTYTLATSNNKPIDDIVEMTMDEVVSQITAFIYALEDKEAINEYYEIIDGKEVGGFNLDAEETLDYLYETIKGRYPEITEMNYTISPLDKSSAAGNTIAYYLHPQLDALDKNVIRTNPYYMGNDPIDDYMTLAHEGIPGHMYQNIYYRNTKPNDFTSTQGFSGYTEGYATYVMMDAIEYSGIKNENTKTIIKFLNIYDYLLMSVCDIEINCYGWDKDDVEDFLEDYYIYEISDALIDWYYDSALCRPGTLVSYGIGYVQINNLYKKASEELGNKFNYEEFHRELIDMGPLPIVILEDKINDYIEEAK